MAICCLALWQVNSTQVVSCLKSPLLEQITAIRWGMRVYIYILLVPYSSSCLMLPTSLGTMRLHFILDLNLLHICPNLLTISFFHRGGGLPSGRLRSLKYHSTAARVHLLSMNLATCLVQQNFCFCYFTITSFILVQNYLASMSYCRVLLKMKGGIVMFVAIIFFLHNVLVFILETKWSEACLFKYFWEMFVFIELTCETLC